MPNQYNRLLKFALSRTRLSEFQQPVKRPESALVLVCTLNGDVLLMERQAAWLLAIGDRFITPG